MTLARSLLILAAATAFGCQSTQTSQGFGPEAEQPRARAAPAPSIADASSLHTIYFDYDQASLGSGARQSLRASAKHLKKARKASMQIQGHADERGSSEYNLALGRRRAEAARRYLVDLGVDGDRLSVMSPGEEHPAVRGHNEAAWTQNGRGVLVPS